MRETFKSLPEDPIELRAVSELLAAEVKSQAYQIEKLKKELAGHRKARFGSKSEAMDQLAFDLQEDIEIAAAAQKTVPADDGDETPPAKRTHNRAPLPDHLERRMGSKIGVGGQNQPGPNYLDFVALTTFFGQ